MKSNRTSSFKNPLIVALDVDTEYEAMAVVDEIQDLVGGFKIGPRLNLRYGNALVQRISQRGPVFVDNKHFDIPSTMEAAIRTSFEAGASLVTIHALSGLETLEKMAALEQELAQQRSFRILGVTMLTSWTSYSLSENFHKKAIADHVLDLARAMIGAGLSSLVCSPMELSLLKALENEVQKVFFKVTPGIRSDKDLNQDQKRVMDPRQALEQGADLLVVGRPILQSSNRREFVTDLLVKLL